MWGWVPVQSADSGTTVTSNGSSGSVKFEIKKHCGTGRFELRIYDESFSTLRPVSELDLDGDAFAAFAECVTRAK